MSARLTVIAMLGVLGACAPRTSPAVASAPAPAPAAIVRPSGLVEFAELDSALAARRLAMVVAGTRAGRGQVGYYADILEARLRQLGIAELQIRREGEMLTLRLGANVAFAPSSARLSDAAREHLARISRVLAEYSACVVTIVGHTDDSGNAQSNQALSEQRALAVLQGFVARGITGQRLLAVGMGAREPVASNASADGRAQNRRVEMRIEIVP